MDMESFVGVDTSESQEPYFDWFQKRFNNFDSFLGTSLVGLEDQATEFLLAVEAELNRRAKVNKKPCGLKDSGGKGLRELKGLFILLIMVVHLLGEVVLIGTRSFLLLNKFEASSLEC